MSRAIQEELRRKKSKVKISVLQPGPVNTNFNNVADVRFSLKGLESEYVAKYTVNKLLKGKFNIVPGFTIKLLKVASKIVPDYFLAKMCYNSQKRKR